MIFYSTTRSDISPYDHNQILKAGSIITYVFITGIEKCYSYVSCEGNVLRSYIYDYIDHDVRRELIAGQKVFILPDLLTPYTIVKVNGDRTLVKEMPGLTTPNYLIRLANMFCTCNIIDLMTCGCKCRGS